MQGGGGGVQNVEKPADVILERSLRANNVKVEKYFFILPIKSIRFPKILSVQSGHFGCENG